jgi:two-component system KDP operon response regulator KdpE
MTPSVLIVDEPNVAKPLANALTSQGYAVRNVTEAQHALADIHARRASLVITDLRIPGMDGLELCRRVRETSNVPIIVVSDQRDYRAEVAALDSGADDFVVKPIPTEALLARVRAALRRYPEHFEPVVLDIGAFHIDLHGRRVHVHGESVRLTPKEFDLFVYMARHPNRVLPHKTLLGAVWGEASADQSEYLRVFVGQLRKKFEADSSNPRYLLTEPWVGYRFNPTGTM